MTKCRLIILCVVGAAIVACVITWLLLPTEPSYQGKSLSAWLRDTNIHGTIPPETSTEVDAAFRHMGTNAFPILKKMMITPDSTLHVKVRDFFRRHPFFKFDLPSQLERQVKVMAVIHSLGPAGKPFVQLLGEDLGKMDVGTEVRIVSLLGMMGPEVEAAVPALIKIANGDNNTLRPWAMNALAEIGFRHPERIKPVFEKCLGDSDPAIQAAAKHSLSMLQYHQQRGD